MDIKLTRKQRERLQREQQILDTANQLLGSQGYLGLTMDKIAEEMEYSKGTIYQHFNCKEEIMARLSIRYIDNLQELFKRALTLAGNARERMSAMFFVYALFWLMRPTDFNNTQLLKTASLREKLSDESRESLSAAERQIQEMLAKIAYDAIEAGDLKSTAMSPEEIVLGLWATTYGGLLILTAAPDLKVSNPYYSLFQTASIFLDGLPWHPLSTEFAYQDVYHRVCKELFVEEIASLPELQQERLKRFFELES